MKIDTFIKLGSLAFNVARDEKVRELIKLAHNGAKRRGFFEPSMIPPNHTGPYHHPGRPQWTRRPW